MMEMVKHVEEWSMKHAVRVDDFEQSAQMGNASQSCLELEPHACACESQRCATLT